MNKLNRTERKVTDKLFRAMYAEHLYEGLVYSHAPGGRYGLVEATRYWKIAKDCPGEFASIGFPETTLASVIDYLEKHDDLVKQLEDYLRERGTLDLTSDELDKLRLS
jgi:hypothetical protein